MALLILILFPAVAYTNGRKELPQKIIKTKNSKTHQLDRRVQRSFQENRKTKTRKLINSIDTFEEVSKKIVKNEKLKNSKTHQFDLPAGRTIPENRKKRKNSKTHRIDRHV